MNIEEMEQTVQRADSYLKEARQYNDQLAGRIEAASEELAKMGFSNEDEAEKKANKVLADAKKAFGKFDKELEKFENDLNEVKQAFDDGEEE